MGDMRNSYKVFVEEPGGKRLLGRPKRRWKDNAKMDLKETGCVDVDWIHLAQDRVQWCVCVNTVMILRVP
jgi:hypothetical protein